MEHIRGNPCSSGNFSQWSEKSLCKTTQREFSMKQVLLHILPLRKEHRKGFMKLYVTFNYTYSWAPTPS